MAIVKMFAVYSMLFPLVVSVLYAIIFWRAGLRGPVIAVTAGPLSAYVFYVFGSRLVSMGYYDSSWMIYSTLVLFGLPLIILAFTRWPSMQAPAYRSSTEKI